MKDVKYYCDMCEKAQPQWDFIHVEIKCSYGYDADCSKLRVTGGTERMNICDSCAKDLGFAKGEGAVKWCEGARKMFIGLRRRLFNKA